MVPHSGFIRQIVCRINLAFARTIRPTGKTGQTKGSQLKPIGDDQIGNIFVYGSLKRDEPLYFLKEIVDLRLDVQPARIVGAVLYDLGPFPGMILKPGRGAVLGEVHRFRHLKTVLEVLDLVEDYHGEENPDNLYRRVHHKAELINGAGFVPCWLYEYVGPVEGAELIECGVWHGPEVQPY